jgi:Tfp pilus assembly protein PilF
MKPDARIQGVGRLVLIPAVFFLVLTGCASTPKHGAAGAGSVSEQGSADDIYDGQPDVLFATEFPVASAEEAIARADHALGKGDVDLALYMYVRAFDLDRENVYALNSIGAIHRSRNNMVMAERAYSRSLAADPDNAVSLEALGLLYLEGERVDAAEQLLKKAVRLDAKRWRAHSSLGVIADMRGDHAEAIAAYNEALALRPEDMSILNNRGYSYYLAGQYDDALQDLEIAAKQGGYKRAWLNLGLVYARRGDYEDALVLMERVVKPEVALNDVGYIAMRQAEYGLAQHYFQEAIRLSPKYFKTAERNLTEVRNLIAGSELMQQREAVAEGS